MKRGERRAKRNGSEGAFGAASTATNKLRNLVGRVTPCAPQPSSDLPNGAHGVTRPTQRLDHVSKSLCRHASLFATRLSSSNQARSAKLENPAAVARNGAGELFSSPAELAFPPLEGNLAAPNPPRWWRQKELRRSGAAARLQPQACGNPFAPGRLRILWIVRTLEDQAK